MTKEEIIAKFPITVEVDADIIDNSNIWNMRKCIGANTLRKAIKTFTDAELIVFWGNEDGYIELDYQTNIWIGTADNIRFMDIETPQTVTLIVI